MNDSDPLVSGVLLLYALLAYFSVCRLPVTVPSGRIFFKSFEDFTKENNGFSALLLSIQYLFIFLLFEFALLTLCLPFISFTLAFISVHCIALACILFMQGSVKLLAVKTQNSLFISFIKASVLVLSYWPSRLVYYITKPISVQSSLVLSRKEQLSTTSMHQSSRDKSLAVEMVMYKNAIDFEHVKTRECLVPRNEIVSIELKASINELREKFAESNYSKVLVFEEEHDNLIAYVHSSDLFKDPIDIKSVLKPVFIVPDSMPAKEVFKQFIAEKKSVAVVVDEFGTTAGMLTIEDIVEKIFGDIDDEHDVVEWTEQKLSADSYRFSGRCEIDYLNSKYNLELPKSDEYDTLAGLILQHLEDIPQPGSILELPNFSFEIENISDSRIEMIKLNVNL